MCRYYFAISLNSNYSSLSLICFTYYFVISMWTCRVLYRGNAKPVRLYTLKNLSKLMNAHMLNKLILNTSVFSTYWGCLSKTFSTSFFKIVLAHKTDMYCLFDVLIILFDIYFVEFQYAQHINTPKLVYKLSMPIQEELCSGVNTTSWWTYCTYISHPPVRFFYAMQKLKH